MKLITIAAVSERIKLGGSLARAGIAEGDTAGVASGHLDLAGVEERMAHPRHADDDLVAHGHEVEGAP